MKNLLAIGRQDKFCEHLDTIADAVGGIQRAICKDCGNVSVSYLADGVTKGAVVSDINQNVSV